MVLKEVYVRFYKSFNYDFLRKNREGVTELPWEKFDGMWYPYIRVPIDESITTIVGANESGKSHLLTAIEKGITGDNINREDFCRYSLFNTVEMGKRRWSDFGFKFIQLDPDDRHALANACEITGPVSCDHFFLFRENKDKLRIFLPQGKEFRPYPVTPEKGKDVLDRLPRPFRIDADIALPTSVPIHWLAQKDDAYNYQEDTVFGRKNRMAVVKALYDSRDRWATADMIKNHAGNLFDALKPFHSGQTKDGEAAAKEREAQYRLAKDLICKVARVDPDELQDLHDAIRDGKDGQVRGIEEGINKRLQAVLNFPHWWVQDRDFSLRVAAREQELDFTIRDKTQTEYSFDERSKWVEVFS